MKGSRLDQRQLFGSGAAEQANRLVKNHSNGGSAVAAVYFSGLRGAALSRTAGISLISGKTGARRAPLQLSQRQ